MSVEHKFAEHGENMSALLTTTTTNNDNNNAYVQHKNVIAHNYDFR